MAINYSNIDSIIGGFQKILKLQTTGVPTNVPTPLILLGSTTRPGLSPTKIASRIIARKSEAGIPVGALPSGGVSPDEIMERIRVEEIIKAIQEDAVITVAIPPGTTLTAAGTSPSGPVNVFGSTITLTRGFGVIQ
ncbi:MAG: hypothetical protein ACOCVF_01770 [bacterium]